MKLADFAEHWQITRQIDDRRLRRLGQLIGSAEFTPSANGLSYTETGTLSFPGQPDLSAKQSYLWSSDGSDITVQFSDGRPFHSFDPTTQNPFAHHHCPPDDYQVSYDFSDWPNWSSEWTVNGPAKDYTMLTRYTRAT